MSQEASSRQLATDIGRRLRRTRNSDPGPDISRLAACLYLGSFVPVIAFVVLRNSAWSNRAGDTESHLSAYDTLQRFSSLFSNANTNPLEGLFDILPNGVRLDMIPNLIGRAVFGPGMSLEFFLVFCAVLLAVTVAAMARTVGMRWSVSVLAGILLPLMILPLSGPFPLAEHFYIVSPNSYYSAAGTVLVTALFWRIDDRSWTGFAIVTAVIVLVLLHLSTTLILSMVFLAPAMVVLGIAALVASKTRGALVAKLASAAITVVALASAGIFHYLYALGSDTSFHVFYRELRDFMLYSAPRWGALLDDARYVTQASLNFQTSIEGVLAPLSQLGAVYLAVFGRTREARIFGRTVLVWILATMAVFVVTHYFYFFTGLLYKGPPAPHFIPILWPYYAICLANLIFAFGEGVVRLASLTWPRIRGLCAFIPHTLPIAALGAVTVFVATHPTPSTMRFTSHRQRTPIVDYLEREIGLAIDRDFRGTVVAMPTAFDKDTNPYSPAYRQRSFFYASAYLGNDMGQLGLWNYNIPTLNQFREDITPQFYLTIREFLTKHKIM